MKMFLKIWSIIGNLGIVVVMKMMIRENRGGNCVYLWNYGLVFVIWEFDIFWIFRIGILIKVYEYNGDF